MTIRLVSQNCTSLDAHMADVGQLLQEGADIVALQEVRVPAGSMQSARSTMRCEFDASIVFGEEPEKSSRAVPAARGMARHSKKAEAVKNGG